MRIDLGGEGEKYIDFIEGIKGRKIYRFDREGGENIDS